MYRDSGPSAINREPLYDFAIIAKERIQKPNGKYKTVAISETGWNDPALLEHWRERWAELVNLKFEEKGLSCRIDHRSNEARGITDAPTVHEGSAVRRMEAKGVRTDKATWNRWVSKTNDMIQRMITVFRMPRRPI